MSIEITNYDNVAVLTVREDLAGEMVELLTDRASQCLEDGGSNVVVDCGSVGGFDSAGLEALLAVQSECEDRLGTLKLCSLNETCAKILEITRLARRFEVFEDLESAVRSFC